MIRVKRVLNFVLVASISFTVVFLAVGMLSPRYVALIIVTAITIITIIAAPSFWQRIKANKRKKELSAWALSRNLRFHPDKRTEMHINYPQFSCLQNGNERYAFNVIEGTFASREICAFNYHYAVAGTEDKDKLNGPDPLGDLLSGHFFFSVVIVKTSMQCKPLLIRQERFLDKIADSAGLDDINFESTEFNNQFHVKSSDRRWAYDVINQSTMELLLSSCRFNIEFNGNCVIAYHNELFSSAYFEEALQLLTGILDNLPESLVQELKGKH